MSKVNIYLTGFMASGKSTIGPIVANTLGWEFYDLDKEIEKRERKTIPDIFKENGEKYFRKLEIEVLKELSTGNSLIISLGGGALTNQLNRKIIKQTGKLIYLESSIEIAFKRLKHKRNRPVLLSENVSEQTEEAIYNKIKLLFGERKKYYEEADYTFNTDNDQIGITVDKIANLVQELTNNK
ncbi:shikimate kinase [bacterium BMS3Abin03]|nr:shikimate kinase [bacterium BMS3Abin03]